MSSDRRKKVCYVVCYKDPSYVRTSSLINALADIRDIELLVIKNRYKSFIRYLEVPLRLLVARLRFKPDIFVVGFRAHEIFWALYPSMLGKPIIFDEFINLHDYLVSEHQKFKKGSWPIKLIDKYMIWVISRCQLVLSDTPAHARLSSQVYKVRQSRFFPIPVGADESHFKPLPHSPGPKFNVLFYGTILPLHGMDIILEAATLLKKSGQLNNIKITLIGGRNKPEARQKIDDFISDKKLSKSINTIDWVDYKDLPAKIAEADLCLGGPFGNTGQASRVITGKTYQFLAMAKPTLIGKIDDADMFKDKKNCLLVERGNPKALAENILWALNNRNKLSKIGRSGRKLYDEDFSTTVIAKRLKKALLL